MPVLESISHSALARKAHGMAAAGAHYKRALGVLQREVEALLAPSQDPFEQFDTTKAKERIRRAFAKAGMDSEDRAFTDARLRLLLDTTRQLVEGEAHYQAGIAQAGEAPAWELYRREDREEPRDWATRWAEACDEAGDEEAAAAFENHGRMVAHKRSGVWQALGDGAGGYSDTLGKPYPPFAFNSGMWTREVSKGRAGKLGFANTTPAEVDGHKGRSGQRGGSTPGDYGMEPFSGRLGKRGYHKSTQSGVALSAKVNPDSVELLRMDVQEQGKGIGGAVLEKLKQFAKDTNRKLWLNARADTPELQPRLRAFYERHGMKPVGNDEYEWNSEVV